MPFFYKFTAHLSRAVCCLAKMAVFDVDSDLTNQNLAFAVSAKLQNMSAPFIGGTFLCVDLFYECSDSFAD